MAAVLASYSAGITSINAEDSASSAGEDIVIGSESGGEDEPVSEEPENVTISFNDYVGRCIASVAVPKGTAIEYSTEDNIFTATFIDAEGNIISKTSIDLKSDALHQHPDKYTEIRFNLWDSAPAVAEEDTVITALYEKALMELVSMPSQTEYYDKSGKINTKGLSLLITRTTQNIDENGTVVNNKSVVDIADTCYTKPADLSEAFAESDIAQISIYPITSDLPYITYTIKYHDGLGDINSDGKVTPVDASTILMHYAAVNTNNPSMLDDGQLFNSDINRDGRITPSDASALLSYYAQKATGNEATWQSFISHNISE